MRRRVRLNIIETETQGMDGRPQGTAPTVQFQRWIIPSIMNYALRIKKEDVSLIHPLLC